MARLVAFGCSLTYGYGLEDCYNTEYFGPSKFAWPNLIASELQIECINKGETGSSNTKILVETLSTTFEKDDIVIFLWSYINRGVVITSPETSINIMPTITHPLKKSFYQVHNQYDLLMASVLAINHATIFLVNKGIKVHNFYVDRLFNSQQNDCKLITLLKDIDLIWVDLHKLKIDLANDKIHPGILSQKEISKFILKNIKKNNLNSLLS
jgi:hypothetical protein